MTLVGVDFPVYSDILRNLVLAHVNLPGERLLLAIYYAPDRDPGDLFLFEIVENFGANTIDEEHELLEVTYA